MINILITADCISMKKVADCILKSKLSIDGTVKKVTEESGGHEMKIKCNTETMLELVHLCGLNGIKINIKTLFTQDQPVTAVLWVI